MATERPEVDEQPRRRFRSGWVWGAIAVNIAWLAVVGLMLVSHGELASWEEPTNERTSPFVIAALFWIASDAVLVASWAAVRRGRAVALIVVPVLVVALVVALVLAGVRWWKPVACYAAGMNWVPKKDICSS